MNFYTLHSNPELLLNYDNRNAIFKKNMPIEIFNELELNDREIVLSQRNLRTPTSGIYAWYFKNMPECVPLENCKIKDGYTLLYIGISPSREGSNGTLIKRIKQHYSGNAGSSTLRRTLGCLLSTELDISLNNNRFICNDNSADNGEDKLSAWMQENAKVSWYECTEPWIMEREILKKQQEQNYSLPLNITHNEKHPFYTELKAIRSRCTK